MGQIIGDLIVGSSNGQHSEGAHQDNCGLDIEKQWDMMFTMFSCCSEGHELDGGHVPHSARAMLAI